MNTSETFIRVIALAVLAGSGVQGMQYAVYQYCREILRVDPFEYGRA